MAPAYQSLVQSVGLAGIGLAITGASLSLGDCIDFADSVPRNEVLPLLLAIAETLTQPPVRDQKPLRRRGLAVLGALITRHLFDCEALPQDRRHTL